MEITKYTTLLAFALLFLHKVNCDEGKTPIGKSHHSYFQFDTENVIEPETAGRNKRAAIAVAFTSNQADEIVRLHNQYRGSVKPEASNMEYMKWDADLARMAMRYSSRCHWGHGHVINVSPFSSVGQNLWIQGLSTKNQVPSASSAINAWYNEIRHYSFGTHECNSPYQCGHYTQLVWADTTAVGCGMSFCSRTSGNWTHTDSWIMTCYYGPAGNYIGVRPYVSGPSCTQCRSEVGQCYNNMCRLCAEVPRNEQHLCECRQQCVNCGVVDQFSCTCVCQDGWYGPDCSQFCNETHPYCMANPGWPGPQFCGQHPMIPKHCPKMCGLCVDPDPTFICNPPPPPGAGGAGGPQLPNNPPATNPPAPAPPARGTAPPVMPTTRRALPPPPRPTNPPVRPPVNPNPPIIPTFPPVRPTQGRYPYPGPTQGRYPFPGPTQPRYPYPGPTAVDCKIPCQNGGQQDIACRCTCTPQFTGQYCQHDQIQIQNGAMLRLVGDIRNWQMMEYDMHKAIEQSVDIFCNKNVAQCCPGVHTAPPTVQQDYLNMLDVMTGTGFPEVDAYNFSSYWTLLVATKPNQPQLCVLDATAGNGGAAVQPALLLRKRYRRDSSSGESEEDGGAGGAPAPQYVEQAIMLNSVDQNMAAIQQVLMMYNVKLAEVQRPSHVVSGASSSYASYTVVVSLVMLLFTALFV